MRGITRSFGPFRALSDVSLQVPYGRVTCLLGENGAGKSTLMHVLSGLYQPDAGEVWVDGQVARLRGPRDALARGIGMVHQHVHLVDTLTVAENIFLGLATPRFLLPARHGHDEVRELGQRCGLPVDPGAVVGTLPVAARQRVEILKVLHRGARVLVLDEPTAVLTPLEVDPFFRAVRELASAGAAVVLISHNLEEVRRVGDLVTVLRRGRVVATGLIPRETPVEELERHILGGPVDRGVLAPPPPPDPAPLPRLHVKGLSAGGDGSARTLTGVEFTVQPGEILGVAGVGGNGQRELAEVIVGLRPARAGAVLLDGRDITALPVRARLSAGLGYIPEDRSRDGVAPSLSVARNLALRAYRAGGPWVPWGSLHRWARHQVVTRDIRVRSVDQGAGQLSGGNQQKLILAREVEAGPRLLVAAQPTRGLDVGAAAAIRQELVGLAARGCAVLLVSEDLPELLALSHRVAVMSRGRVVGVLRRELASVESVGRLMLGGAVAA
jgi:simple sugar transport system ATP-binding protein